VKSPIAEIRRNKAYKIMQEAIEERNINTLDILQRIGIATDIVHSGPFVGMKYISTSKGSLLTPKILGTYEIEIQKWIEEFANNRYSQILDIGCAEGFYACGLLLLFPDLKVIASDTDPSALKSTVNLCQINGVENRLITVDGLDHKSLQGILKPKTLIICDIEGAENELLDPCRVQELVSCDMIVEIHEMIMPGVLTSIIDRFVNTHTIDACWVMPIDERISLLEKNHNLSGIARDDINGLIDEARPTNQCWLRLRSAINNL
jgi:hypothetical protein